MRKMDYCRYDSPTNFGEIGINDKRGEFYLDRPLENGIYMENVKEIKDVKKDMDETLKDCKRLNDKDIKSSIFKSIWQSILRLFAPLF